MSSSKIEGWWLLIFNTLWHDIRCIHIHKFIHLFLSLPSKSWQILVFWQPPYCHHAPNSFFLIIIYYNTYTTYYYFSSSNVVPRHTSSGTSVFSRAAVSNQRQQLRNRTNCAPTYIIIVVPFQPLPTHHRQSPRHPASFTLHNRFRSPRTGCRNATATTTTTSTADSSTAETTAALHFRA